jgi:peptidoglycan/LPS O-acetylase OafA/YrhL
MSGTAIALCFAPERHEYPMISRDSKNLDVLRAFAVLSVFVSHIQQFVLHLPFHLYQQARFGVLIFFVHTCLVLLFSLERSRHGLAGTWVSFYIRRAFRIYPLSVITVLAVVFLHVPRAPDVVYQATSLKDLLSNLALTQNLTHTLGIPATLWSLPFEVQMYAVLPVLFLVFARRSVWYGLALWGIAIAAGRLLSPPNILDFTPCFLGGLIAYQAIRNGRQGRLPAWLWPVALPVVAALHAVLWRSSGLDQYKMLLGGYLTCLILGVLIPMFRELPDSRLTKGAHIVAKYSYGIYLCHMPVIWLAFVKLAFLPLIARWTLLTVIMIGLPWALYRWLEEPMIDAGRSLADQLCSKVRAAQRNMAQVAEEG